ncbi:RNA polymerase sigma factor [Ulvibacterium marinum]|uniref:RNA polymerase sigma factor n=1 Tax=Ulvibacterium marinum TaxID=2419782 RepID=A0A3B0C4H4_9FLAO|nr:sigma-70 family RNA polymerase sigma factor [Ulvibacterium marinum]RKN81055.1 sigma-70 family RNA polymerase sigma factor [Ulvibacterium marinum]
MSLETPNNDIFLINRIKDGDTGAFRQLVEKYKNVSLSLACSILKDEIRAEDVLQDVFVKVFEKVDAFNFNSAFSTWLYRIVVNTSYNELKKYKNQTSLSQVDLKPEKSIDNTALNDLKEEEQEKYIRVALNRLKADQALILRLFYLCDLKITEIEDITGFKSSKIKVDLHRGRINLDKELKKLLGNEIHDLL